MFSSFHFIQSSNEESEDMRSQLNVAREQKRAVEAKYVGGKKMSKKDRKKLDTLKRQERWGEYEYLYL